MGKKSNRQQPRIVFKKDGGEIYQLSNVIDINDRDTATLIRINDGAAKRVHKDVLMSDYLYMIESHIDIMLNLLKDNEYFPAPLTLDQVLSYSTIKDESRQLAKATQKLTQQAQTEREQPKESEDQKAKLGFLVEPTERHDLGKLVLNAGVKESIMTAIKKIELREFLNETWNLKSIEPVSGRIGINMYGPPGTGKTISALAVAKELNKPMLQVDYSSIVSKYVGDTAKHIKSLFEEARAAKAILFFDEADSLLNKRLDLSTNTDSYANSANQSKNVFMQELDKHDDVVIFATNFFSNYDEALLRRIAHHVEFKLPDAAQRESLYRSHIPMEIPGVYDLQALSKASDGLSGGDIKNVCMNAIVAAAMSDERKLTQSYLEKALDDVKTAKNDSKGNHKEKIVSLIK